MGKALSASLSTPGVEMSVNMHVLYPVKPEETFVASGRYTRPGDPAPTETWSIHQLPDRTRIVRSEDSLTQYAVWEAPTADGWRVTRVYTQYDYKGHGGNCLYTFHADHVDADAQMNDAPRATSTGALPQDYVFSYGYMYSMAAYAKFGANHQGTFTLLSASFNDSETGYVGLTTVTGGKPGFSHVGSDTVEIEGRPIPTEVYMIDYERSVERYAVDSHGVVVRLVTDNYTANRRFEVLIEDYRRAEW